jgi:ParB family chromosome partitioning protein
MSDHPQITADLDTLSPSKRNPRRLEFKEGLGELVESVKKHGVLTPLLVRKNGEAGKLEILAGHRRYAAAKAAGLKSVPCRVIEADDDLAYEIMVVENLQRQDVHWLDEAEGFAHLLDRSNGDYDGVAAKVSKSRQYVVQHLVLVKLIPEVKEAAKKGDVDINVAFQVARLSPEIQAQLTKYYRGWKGAPGSTEVRREIEAKVFMDLKYARWDQKGEAFVDGKAGPCAVCPKRSGVSKDLFSDVAGGGTCTDKLCFNGKMERVISAAMADHKEKGLKLHRVSAHYRQDKKSGVLGSDQYVKVENGKNCPNVEHGILVDEYSGERGKVVEICVGKDCKIHHDRYGGTSVTRAKRPEKELEAERKERQKEKRGLQKSHAALDLILSKQPWNAEVAGLVAGKFFADIWYEHRKQIAIRRGWIKRASDADGFGFERLCMEKAGKMKLDEIQGLLMELGLIKLLSKNAVGGELKERCNDLKITNDKIEDQLKVVVARDEARAAAIREEKKAKDAKKPKGEKPEHGDVEDGDEE